MSDETHPSSGSTVRISGAVVLLLILLAGVAAYSFHVRNVAKGLAAQNSEISSTLNATRGQLEALTAKINDLSAAQASNKPSASQAVAHSVAARLPKTAVTAQNILKYSQGRFGIDRGSLVGLKKNGCS